MMVIVNHSCESLDCFDCCWFREVGDCLDLRWDGLDTVGAYLVAQEFHHWFWPFTFVFLDYKS